MPTQPRLVPRRTQHVAPGPPGGGRGGARTCQGLRSGPASGEPSSLPGCSFVWLFYLLHFLVLSHWISKYPHLKVSVEIK